MSDIKHDVPIEYMLDPSKFVRDRIAMSHYMMGQISNTVSRNSDAVKRAIFTAPDVETYSTIYDMNDGDDGKAARTYLRGLVKGYPNRVINDYSEKWDVTPWSNEYLSPNRSHPQAIIHPRDMQGFLVQGGDPLEKWGKRNKIWDRDKFIAENAKKDGMTSGLETIIEALNDSTDSTDLMNMFGAHIGKGWTIEPNLPKNYIYPADDYHIFDFPNAYSAYSGLYSEYPNRTDYGFSGDKSTIDHLDLALTNLNKARTSADAGDRGIANLFMRLAPYFKNTTMYNPRSAAYTGDNKVIFRSPQQTLSPSHGAPGSAPFEELWHGIDNVLGEYKYSPHFTKNFLSQGNVFENNGRSSIYNALKDDYLTKWNRDPEKIKEATNKVIEGWKSPTGGRYADYHEWIQLMNHLYNVGTGKNADGKMGKLYNHRIHDKAGPVSPEDMDTSTFTTEAMNSLTNPRFTNRGEMPKIKESFPHAVKAAEQIYKEGNDYLDEDKKLPKSW